MGCSQSSVILKARFWPKDLPQCFRLKCSGLALTRKPTSIVPRAWKVQFSPTHFGRSFAQKKRFRMTEAERAGERTVIGPIGKKKKPRVTAGLNFAFELSSSEASSLAAALSTFRPYRRGRRALELPSSLPEAR